MKPFHNPKKILWAVDAYQESGDAFRNVTRAIDRFASFFKAEVELVYAFAIPQMLMDRKSFEIFQAPYLQEAEANLRRIAKNLKRVTASVTVLSNASDPKKPGELTQILNYAAKKGFGMIAVATHGRNAFLKLFLGSFAEGLLNHSPIPLLAIPPHAKNSVKKRPINALFPTDFSPSSRKTFESLLSLAQKNGLKLNIVHGLTNPYIPSVLSDASLMGDTFSMQSQVFRECLEEREAKLRSWIEACQKKNVAATAGKIYRSGGLVSDIVCHAAKKDKADFIVMATNAGKPSYETLGSVTKKVMRKAETPVLVLKY